MIGRQRDGKDASLDRLVSETSDLVSRLLRENRALKARNRQLEKEVERLSQGWDNVRKLARSAPRARRARSRR
jgi:cell division protein FtsB